MIRAGSSRWWDLEPPLPLPEAWIPSHRTAWCNTAVGQQQCSTSLGAIKQVPRFSPGTGNLQGKGVLILAQEAYWMLPSQIDLRFPFSFAGFKRSFEQWGHGLMWKPLGLWLFSPHGSKSGLGSTWKDNVALPLFENESAGFMWEVGTCSLRPHLEVSNSSRIPDLSRGREATGAEAAGQQTSRFMFIYASTDLRLVYDILA